MSNYPFVPFSEALTPSPDSVTLDPATEYRLGGIFSFGRGIFERDSILGTQTSYKHLAPLRKNQLVFGRLNAWEGGIAVVDPASEGLFVSPEFPVLDINQARADPLYVSYLCRWPYLWDSLMERSRGLGARTGARRLRVHEKRLLEVPVPLPDIDEQRRVATLLHDHVARFEKLMARIDVRPPDQFLTLIPRLLDAVLRTVPSVAMSVGELADIVSDTVHPGDDIGSATAFVGLQHIEGQTGRLIGSMPLGDEKGRKFRFQPGDVVYGYLRPYLNKVWVADRHGLCSVDQYVLRPKGSVPSRLLAASLRTATVLDQAVELTHNLQLPRLRSGLLLAIELPWPLESHKTIAEEALAETLETACRVVDLRREQMQARDALIPSLLNQAFAGHL